jgi:hypothetical protein
VPDEAAAKLGRGASLLGRIGVRAFIIVLLMLAALGALAGNGLQILAQQNTIIEQLGVRDRVAIDAENAFSTPVADFSSAFSAVAWRWSLLAAPLRVARRNWTCRSSRS